MYKISASCHVGVNITLFLTTDVMIFISILQTFRSRVAIFTFASLWCFYITAITKCKGTRLLWINELLKPYEKKIRFRFFLSHVKFEKRKGNTYLSSLIYDFTAKNALISVRYLYELKLVSLLKCFPVLYNKLIFELAIFHSKNGETCDKRRCIRYKENINEIWQY